MSTSPSARSRRVQRWPQDFGRRGTGQVIASAADICDVVLVPALYARFVPTLAGAAAIDPGARFLDVGSGTGVAALAAAERAGSGGQ